MCSVHTVFIVDVRDVCYCNNLTTVRNTLLYINVSNFFTVHVYTYMES